MKKVWVFILFSFLSLLVNGQTPSPDELLKKLHHAGSDSVKAATYYELVKASRNSDIQKAKQYLDSGYYYFKKSGDIAGMEQRNYIEATLAYTQGDYVHALQNGLKYDAWTKSTGDIEKEWYAVSMLAMCYRETGDYPKGIKSSLRGIEIGLQLNRDEENGFFYNELGNLYSTLQQWDEAYKYLKKSYDLAISTKYPAGQSVSLRNLAANALERKRFDNARSYIMESMDIDASIGSQQGQCRSLQSLARLFELKSEPDSAILSLRKALTFLSATSDPYDFATIYQGLAKNYLSKNKLDSVLHYIQWSSQKASKSNQVAFISEQKRIEAAAFEKKGDYKKAFDALKSYVDKNGEQITSDITHQIAGLNVQFDTKRKEDEIALLTTGKELSETKLRVARQTSIGLGIGALLFSALALGIYLLFKKTKSQNTQIQKALSEKETLIREIHHRVKNNLQFISSLLNLQSRHVVDTAAFNALKEGQNRVKSMALIHQNLYQEDNLTGIETKKYFESLMQNLFQSYNISPDKIKLITHIDTLQIDVDSMIPLGLIMNELISNALKYAFPESNTGTITVNLSEQKGSLILKVADNGIGMPVNKINTVGQSFGYRLINAFKSQLDAVLEIKNEHGTEVVMHIKNYKKAV
ncbi:MAG: histidine kinase dimerization/phosphoacceptor domain -containing protein [Saprospiraceae bacterium]